jgi:tape measure domain-containing protein
VNEPVVYTVIVQDGASPAYERLTANINASGEAGARSAARIAGGLQQVYQEAAAANRQVVSLKSQLDQLHNWNAGGGSGASTGPLAPFSQGAQPMQALVQGWSTLGEASDKATTKLKAADVELKQKPADASRAGAAISGLMKSFLAYQAIDLFRQALSAASDEMERSVKAASDLETLRRSYASIFGGSAQGDQYIAQVRKLANDTSAPFAQTALAEDRLVASGMRLASVGPVLTGLSAVAKAYGASTEDVNGALTAFTQIQEKNRLESEEARRQLSNRNIPVLQIYARETHTTVAQVTADMQAGKISADQFFDVFSRGAMSMYGSVLDPANRTFADIQTQLDNTNQLLEAVFGQATMEKRKSADAEWLKTLQDPKTEVTIKGWGEAFGQVGGYIEGLKTKTAGFFNWFDSYLKDHGTNESEYLRTVIKLATNIDINTFNTQQGETNKQFSGTVNVLDQATVAAVKYQQALDDLAAVQDKMQRSEQLLMRSYDDKIDALQRQNELLQQRKQLEDYLAGLGKANDQYSKDRAAAVNILFASGRNARDRLGDDQAAIASAQRNLS